MKNIQQDAPREIVDDFAAEIVEKRVETSAGEKTRINFRDGVRRNREEKVYHVPLDLLRYRKENGRISAAVKTHELRVGRLDPRDESAQKKLGSFLREMGPEKTDDLKRLLQADGQREPGIATADGFLVNGNRRKLALTELRDDNPGDDQFNTMKVVILPGRQDPGGPPTLREIEQIENRYQLQDEGKAEYSGFDAALSMRDKEEKGYTLEEQLRDDPKYKSMEKKKFDGEVKRRHDEVFEPLRLVDEYLQAIGRPGEYTLVAHAGRGGEGRWQAFLDLAKYLSCKVRTVAGLEKIGLEDSGQAARVLQAAYATIRLREVPTFGKLHGIMRQMPKMCRGGKEHLLDLERNVKHRLPDKEMVDERGKPLTDREIEARWKSKYEAEITRQLVKAREDSDDTKERSAPVELLADAQDKLCHRNMVVARIDMEELDTAIQLAEGIRDRAEALRKEIWVRMKKRKGYQKIGLLPEDRES